MGPVWFHVALLKQRELFAQKKVLGCQCPARPGNEQEETDRIARDGGQRPESALAVGRRSRA
jgi:hypothetical protein